jgi:hypothetical protein
LKVDAISDAAVREAFQLIRDELQKFAILKGEFKHLEREFTKAATNLRFKHHLGFTPKDIIQTSLIGDGTLSWNYTEFDDEFLDVTVTGACTVRAFIGSYREGNL